MVTERDMKELEFERKLITHLSTGTITPKFNMWGDNSTVYKSKLWEDASHIKTTEDLWNNFREIIYQLNQDKLKQPLSDTEFGQVKKVIEELHTPYEAGQFLYGSNGKSEIEVNLDTGDRKVLIVFNQDEIGAGNTRYQVVSQIMRPAKIPGRPDRRFDTTLLINGLPIIQIEEKTDKGSSNEALNQMHQYIEERQYTDIFSTLQILVAMTPTQIKYMANTTAELFNKDFAFEWQNPDDNKIVYDWRRFSDLFLSIPMAHQMATHFTILDGTKNKQMLKVMRPYQVYATRAVIEALKYGDFHNPVNKIGYIWHTTGSGKTITSFKTAWLASRLPNVDKVIFVVDRIALTRQTEECYKAYDPQGSVDVGGKVYDTIGGTENTNQLKAKIAGKGNQIIVTSVQKLNTLIKRKDFVLPKKNFVFIVDEAHRSTGSEGFEEIQKAFKGAAWIGYTGTPQFDETVGKKGTKTHEVFGRLLHAYTIREAIADRNVLGFKVDFQTTIDDESMKKEYLPNFYAKKYPDWTQEDIDYKIANLTPDDMDDMVESSFYDNNKEHVRVVVEDIFKHWRNRSSDGAYNAMLTTHVGGNRPSTEMAMMYFDEFERVNQERAEKGLFTLKVGITYSVVTNNKDHQLKTNQDLLRAMNHYNHLFGTKFGLDDVSGYTQDLTTRLNRTAQDEQYLDLVIVVDQLLTGFDAPQLNTLYVDRTLKNALLIQAYSRTNRIADNMTKPWGRIVNYRWPVENEKLMNRALSIYANKASANVQEELFDPQDLIDDGILAYSFATHMQEVQDVVHQLRGITDSFTEVPPSESKQEEMFRLMRKYSAGISKLKQYDPEVGGEAGFDYDNPDELIRLVGMDLEEERRLVTALYNDLKERMATRHNVPVWQIELRMTKVKDVEVTYDYLTELLEMCINQVQERDMEGAMKSRKAINEITLGMENRVQAHRINRAVDAILKGEYPPKGEVVQYPIRLNSVEELVEKVYATTVENKILAFLLDWGIKDIITTEEILDMFSYHEYGKKDLDRNSRLDALKKKARQGCQEKAQRKELTTMGSLKYGNELIKELYKLADDHVIDSQF